MPSYDARPANPLELFPPDGWHIFKHVDEVPFNHRTGTRDFGDAYWLAEASLYAYAWPWRPDYATAGFETAFGSRNGGGTNVVVQANTGKQYGATWYLVTTDEYQVLVFRGSNVVGSRWDARQFMAAYKSWFVTNADAFLCAWPHGGRIHTGFGNAYGEVALDILHYLQPTANKPLFITGHSLGGGLAAVAASDLLAQGYRSTVYTFAAPRVGDSDFAAACTSIRTFRFVDSLDLVPRVPPRSSLFGGAYVHYPEDGRRYSFSLRAALDTALDQTLESYVLELAGHEIVAPLETIEGVFNGQITGNALALFRPIVDHAPVLYVIAAYNDWLGQQ